MMFYLGKISEVLRTLVRPEAALRENTVRLLRGKSKRTRLSAYETFYEAPEVASVDMWQVQDFSGGVAYTSSIEACVLRREL